MRLPRKCQNRVDFSNDFAHLQAWREMRRLVRRSRETSESGNDSRLRLTI